MTLQNHESHMGVLLLEPGFVVVVAADPQVNLTARYRHCTGNTALLSSSRKQIHKETEQCWKAADESSRQEISLSKRNIISSY